MGMGGKVQELYRRANESFGRHGIVWALVFFVLPFISLGALAGYLATTAEWYWRHLGWLGVLLAVLVAWVLLGCAFLLVKALFHPKWLERKPANPVVTTDQPIQSVAEPKAPEWMMPQAFLEMCDPDVTARVKDANTRLGEAERKAQAIEERIRAAQQKSKTLGYGYLTQGAPGDRQEYENAEALRKAIQNHLVDLLNNRRVKLIRELEKGTYIAQGFVTPRRRGSRR